VYGFVSLHRCLPWLGFFIFFRCVTARGAPAVRFATVFGPSLVFVTHGAPPRCFWLLGLPRALPVSLHFIFSVFLGLVLRAATAVRSEPSPDRAPG
jgi:hypothetical protein